MTYKQTTNGYILRFNKNDQLVAGLQDFCVNQQIKGGLLTGLGGASQIELGFYDLEASEYIFKTFSDLHEVTNLTGNVSLSDGVPFLHIHVTLSNKDLVAFGGHLKEATVGGTVEIYINTSVGELKRTVDSETSLNLLDL